MVRFLQALPAHCVVSGHSVVGAITLSLLCRCCANAVSSVVPCRNPVVTVSLLRYCCSCGPGWLRGRLGWGRYSMANRPAAIFRILEKE